MGLLINKIYANFLLIKCSLDKKQYCCVLTLMFTSPIVKQNQELDQNMIVWRNDFEETVRLFFGIYTKRWTGIGRVKTEEKTPNCDWKSLPRRLNEFRVFIHFSLILSECVRNQKDIVFPRIFSVLFALS